MRKIKEMVDQINDEICDAKDYAEKYLDRKANNDTFLANRYREMAMDELKHADYLHENAVAEIEKLSQVFVTPVEMEEEWEKSHKAYVEKAAWVKTMLNM